METGGETLEKVADLGLPKGLPKFDEKRKLKFRVSYKVTVRGTDKAHTTGFSYHDLASARRCYRDILLAFYKSREVESFSICLNHYGSKTWEKPIHIESVGGQ